MNQQLLIQFLENLSIEELFFRICYKKQYSAEQIRSIMQTISTMQMLSVRPTFPDGTPIPESMHMLSAQILPEEHSCETLHHRRVRILKHPCFMPPINHSHDYFEAVYVLSGTCHHYIFERDMQLHTGDLCLISPTVSHSISADGDSIVLLLQVSTATFENLYSSVIHDHSTDAVTTFFRNVLYRKGYVSYLLFHTADDKQIQSQILDMLLEEFQAEEYADYMITNMLIIFFIKIIRKYKKTVQTPPFIPPSYAEASYIFQYIQANYATASLNSLAKQLNYSVPYCSKYVRQYTGHSFSDLLKQVRFHFATEYLLNSDLTVEKISERIGYANPENFMRMFKKTYGVSPTQYRAIGDRSLKPLAENSPPRKIHHLQSMETASEH